MPGVASVAYFEEWGERGIRSASGEPFPVAAAIDALAALRTPDARLLWGESPDGLVWAVGARRDDQDVVLVANLDERQREVTIAIASESKADAADSATADESSAASVRSATVALEPLAFTRIALDR